MIRHYRNLVAIFLFFSLGLYGCFATISSIEKEQNLEFRVNNPEASFFDIQKRIKFLKSTDDSVLLGLLVSTSSEFDCAKYPIPKPVNYRLTMPEFYKDWLFPKKVDTVKRKISIFVSHIQPE